MCNFRRGAPLFCGSQPRGMTFVEVLVSMGLAVLGVLVFQAYFPAAPQALAQSRHTDLAMNACEVQLEAYRDAGYFSLPDVPQGSTYTQIEFTPPAALPAATGTVTVTRVDEDLQPTSADTGLVMVEVAIAWSQRGRDRGTARVSTVMSR